MLAYIAIVVAVLVISLGQILFKVAALQVVDVAGMSAYGAVVANVRPIGLILLALTLYFLSTLGWVWALRTVPLSVAYMFNAASFILIPVVSLLVFRERLDGTFVIGAVVVLIGIGVILYGRSG